MVVVVPWEFVTRGRLGDVFGKAWGLCLLGSVAYLEADHVRARSLYEKSLAILRALDTQADVAVLRRSSGDRRSPLTAREREVAMHVARGLTNREIAVALVLSERTVEAHVAHICQKLDFRSRAQVAVWAATQGMLDGET